MIYRKLHNFFLGTIDKGLLEISQIQQSIATIQQSIPTIQQSIPTIQQSIATIQQSIPTIQQSIATISQEIKDMQKLQAEVNKLFLQSLLEVDVKTELMNSMSALSSYQLGDAVLAELNAAVASAGEENDAAAVLGEILLMEGPLWLNEGISRRLPLEERLATLKAYSLDLGYRHRLHLIKLLQWKHQLASAKAANREIFEQLTEIAGADRATGADTPPAPPASPVEVQAQLFWGEDFIIWEKDLVGRLLWEDQYIEPGLTQFILLNLHKNAFFFDIGAHFGYYSRLASQILMFPGQIHAFEPTLSTFDILQRNCRQLPGIHLNNAAIWGETGEIMFTEMGEAFSAFNTAVSPRLTEFHLKDTSPTQRKVSAFSLDDYVARTGVVCDFVKIDAEGAEAEILKGMQGLLTGPRPIVTLEVGDIGPGSGGASRALIDTMLGYGYDVFEFSGGRIRRHELRETYEYDNMFFVPAPA